MGAASKVHRRVERSRSLSLAQPIGAARELWVRLQVLVRRMRYLCDTHTGRSRPWSHYVIWSSLGEIFEF